MERLTIGQLAKQARVNRETVRYYERRRLLQRPSRSMAVSYRLLKFEFE
jgi:DNA-binding transcriptional MerR regulator